MEQLRDWRKAKGMSIEEAGALVRVSGVQWHRYENGTRRVPVDKVLDVARMTGIPASDLRPDLADFFESSKRRGEAA